MTSDERTDDDKPTEPSSIDPEAPEADALDQAREVVPGERHRPVSRAIDAPEADAIEQSIELPIEPDDEPPPPDDQP